MKELEKKQDIKGEKVTVSGQNGYGKAFKTDIFIISLAVIVFGALFVTFSADALKVLCYVFGIAMCVWGVISIIAYFLSNKYSIFNSYGLVRGIAFLALGIVVLANPAQVADLFISIFGALIIIDGALKLQYSVDLIRIKAKGWQILMGAAFVVIIMGCIIIFNPFGSDAQATLMFFTGITMLIDGVCDVAMVVYISGVIKKLAKADSEEAA